jgi:hypothetical protein
VNEIDFDVEPVIRLLLEVVKKPVKRVTLVENAIASFVNLATSGMLFVFHD